MAARSTVRNRLAKPLPETWRRWLAEQGVPKRKYTAIARLTLVGGRVVEDVVLEEGWVVGVGRERVAGVFEQRLDFDPRLIEAIEILQSA